MCPHTDNFHFQGCPGDTSSSLPSSGQRKQEEFCILGWHRGKQCTYTSNEQLWSRGCPLHNSFHSEHDHKGATGGLWVVVGLSRQQVATKTTGDLVEVHVWEFFTPHISCASGELQHPWVSWKWMQTLFAKALYIMAICLFGVWVLSHAVLRCRRRRVGTAI